jgi:hypothetical protein
MDYKIVLDFDKKKYSVEPAIKLKKNERYIDKLLINVISSVPNLHYLKMKFKGFITLVEDTLVLIPKEENEYFNKFKIDGRFTKEVDNGFLSFELFDINNQSISISDNLNVDVDMSTFPIADCEDVNPAKKSHMDLIGRELPDQHPKQSVIGLEDDLKKLNNEDDKINIEIDKLKAEDIKIYEAIEKEKTERTEEDNKINNKLDKIENTTIPNLEKDLNDKITDETKERIRNDNLEIKAREDADNLEITTRTEEDTKLRKEIKNNSDEIDTIKTNINILDTENKKEIQLLKDKDILLTNEDVKLDVKIDKEIEDRKKAILDTNKKVDELELNTNINIKELDDKIELNKTDIIKLDNTKLEKTEIGKSVAPLGKDGFLPTSFLPAVALKTLEYFITIEARDKFNAKATDWCYVEGENSEVKKFFYYQNDDWLPVTSILEIKLEADFIKFNNTGTDLNSINVQNVIIELLDLIKNSNLDIEEVKKQVLELDKKINKEIQDRIDAIYDLENKINEDFDEERKKRKEDIDNLQSQIDLLNQLNTAIDGNITAFLEELAKKANQDYVETEIKDLNDKIDNETTRAKDKEKELEDKIDGIETTTTQNSQNIASLTGNLSNVNATLNAGFVKSVNTKTGEVVLTKTDVGLSNVDNTLDINKPLSSIQKKYVDDALKTLDISSLDLSSLNLENLNNNVKTIKVDDNIISPDANGQVDLTGQFANNDINAATSQEIIDNIDTHNEDELAHEKIQEIIPNKIKLDNFNIIEAQNKQFDLSSVVESASNDEKINTYIQIHNNNLNSHPSIVNDIQALKDEVDTNKPFYIMTIENSIEDFIKNDAQAKTIKHGNHVILKDASIYHFISKSTLLSTRVATDWYLIDNYIKTTQDIKINVVDNLNSLSKTDPLSANQGKVLNDKITNFLDFDNLTTKGGFIYSYKEITANDMPTTREELVSKITNRVFAQRDIMRYGADSYYVITSFDFPETTYISRMSYVKINGVWSAEIEYEENYEEVIFPLAFEEI